MEYAKDNPKKVNIILALQNENNLLRLSLANLCTLTLKKRSAISSKRWRSE
jgi:hypothetical protein